MTATAREFSFFKEIFYVLRAQYSASHDLFQQFRKHMNIRLLPNVFHTFSELVMLG